MSSVLVETLAAWQELSVTAGIWAFFVGKEEMKLKSYIKEDMRRRIQSGQDVPQPLTLANLSEQYGVSFTWPSANSSKRDGSARNRQMDDWRLIQKNNCISLSSVPHFIG